MTRSYRGSGCTALLCAIVIAGVALRCLRLDNGLWYDEGFSLHFARAASFGALMHELAETTASERLQQLYTVLLHYWRGAFGESEPSLRALSVLLGSAAILLLADAARRLGGRRAALAAALLAACNSYLVVYSGEIRATALLVLLSACLLDAWAADLVRPTRGARLAGVCASVLLCLGSVYGYVGLFAFAVGDRRFWSETRRWAGFWLPVGIAAAAVLAFFYGPIALEGNVRVYAGAVHSQGLLPSVLFVIYGITVGQTYGPPVEQLHGPERTALLLHYAPQLLLYAAVMAVLAMRLLVAIRRPDPNAPLRRNLASLLLMFALATATGAVLGRVEDLNWLPRHAFYLAPLFVLIAALLATLDRTRWTVAALAALVLLNGIAIANMRLQGQYALDDYRRVAAWLNSPAARGATPVLLLGLGELLHDYYHVPALIDAHEVKPAELDARLPALTHDAPELIAIINREVYWVPRPEQTFTDVFAAKNYRITEHVRFAYFDLYRLSRR